MPFEITITINSRAVVRIQGHNCDSPTGDREIPTRIYRYTATHLETGVTTGGEILHERPEGIVRLAAIILDDMAISFKTNRSLRQPGRFKGEIQITDDFDITPDDFGIGTDGNTDVDSKD